MCLTVVESVIKRHKNNRPGRITLQIKESFPIRDNSSRFVDFLREDHAMSEVDISVCLSSGILIVKSEESMIMPRYVIMADGPSNLSSAIGTLI